MSRCTYWGSPYVLWLFSMNVLDAIALKQELKMPASPDLLPLICQHNSRYACKPPPGSHGSSEYLCLIWAFIQNHSRLTDPQHRGWCSPVSLQPPLKKTLRNGGMMHKSPKRRLWGGNGAGILMKKKWVNLGVHEQYPVCTRHILAFWRVCPPLHGTSCWV